ncbi:rhodanese-like domain-containing protein [Gracilimonas sediminicola]|uniref:Rhodanese-like domain-containing protein n=1 Tax=Gracilimonas sediminicola TaxID=2952158 RepID=A0A9X2L2Y9_9BACT|nr:rhodanese-like domain-containing protein [Gracilimonas sediminicola]MCP9291353.1 rhodanese-like domain-containing protein [Gracilimonas sediminicola]
MKEVTVQELKEKRESNEDFFLLDVREDVEYLVSNLDGEHIPLGQLENRMKEIEDKKSEEVIVMCRSGGRSSKAVSYLENNGFEKVANLKGGMKAWASEIDPSVPVA